MRSYLIPSLLLGIALGCSSEAVTDATVPTVNVRAAGNSGCYTVTGRIIQSGVFPNFAGVIIGDIEGDVVTTLDPPTFHGPTQHVTGEQTWHVTGGSVPGLNEVTLALDGVVVLVQPPEFQNNTTATVIAGADRGNLTYHGVVDVSTFPVATDVEYHGVICP